MIIGGIAVQRASVYQYNNKLFIAGISVTSKGVPTEDPRTRVVISALATPREKGEAVLTAMHNARTTIQHPWLNWNRYFRKCDEWIGVKHKELIKVAKYTSVEEREGLFCIKKWTRHAKGMGFDYSHRPDVVLYNPTHEQVGGAVEQALGEFE